MYNEHDFVEMMIGLLSLHESVHVHARDSSVRRLSNYVLYGHVHVHCIRVAMDFRDRRILLEKVADSARKAVKLAEPYTPYSGQFLEFCSISFIHNTKHAYQKKYRILPIFLPAESADPPNDQKDH